MRRVLQLVALTVLLVAVAASPHVPSPVMKEHLHSSQWMNVDKHPEITFEAKSLKNTKTSGNTTTGDVAGSLTLKGVSREPVNER